VQGVFLTMELSPSGHNRLKRVRFARGRFSRQQAEDWWQAHKRDVALRCNLAPLTSAAAESPPISHARCATRTDLMLCMVMAPNIQH
jgi:hypothetical protein